MFRSCGLISPAVAFVAALSILMGWRDFALAMRFVTGFQAIGKLEDSHNWTPVEIDEPVSWEQIYQEKLGPMRELDARPPEDEAQFLWDSLLEENMPRALPTPHSRKRRLINAILGGHPRCVSATPKPRANAVASTTRSARARTA